MSCSLTTSFTAGWRQAPALLGHSRGHTQSCSQAGGWLLLGATALAGCLACLKRWPPLGHGGTEKLRLANACALRWQRPGVPAFTDAASQHAAAGIGAQRHQRQPDGGRCCGGVGPAAGRLPKHWGSRHSADSSQRRSTCGAAAALPRQLVLLLLLACLAASFRHVRAQAANSPPAAAYAPGFWAFQPTYAQDTHESPAVSVPRFTFQMYFSYLVVGSDAYTTSYAPSNVGYYIQNATTGALANYVNFVTGCAIFGRVRT